jgi:alkylation response protein AidB-like acyl-CoA dehydrogenase
MSTDATAIDVQTFRERARAWITRNVPRGEQVDGLEVSDDQANVVVGEARAIQRRIFDAGFAGIRFDKRYGGQGLTRSHQVAWAEAGAGYQLPGTFNVTHGILAPTLLEFGSEEQKDRHIPAMLRGDELWVQFLSEPSGGSDLAGLLTRAQRDGDIYRVNGSKVWTTGAQHCQFGLILVRTDLDVPKHQGLSMFIVAPDMDGLSIVPIRLSTGASQFCQEFFDDVAVPASNLVGAENDGWRVTTRLLFHERNMVGANSYNDHMVLSTGEEDEDDDLVALVRRLGLDRDPATRQLVGEGIALRLLVPPTIQRINALLRTGEMQGPAAAILKLLGSTVDLRRAHIGVEVAGSEAVAWQPGDSSEGIGTHWLAARIPTIAGGSSEIQLNQISERVLGLPREYTPDRDIPFREVLNTEREK